MHRSIAFAFRASPGDTEGQARTLASSIRSFGGRFADAPIWATIAGAPNDLSEGLRKDLATLRTQLVSFGIKPDTRSFPFAPKVYGAAAAESLAQGQVDLLVWMDSDSIVIREPRELVLAANYVLGYRPVDHTLIGSRSDASVDGFWRAIYGKCGVPREALFPMTTTVDRVRIRPYFNAGLVVVRPEAGLLRSWRDALGRLLRDRAFDAFFEKSVLYKYFLHQAALAGTVLVSADVHQMQQLSHVCGYPLHMHSHYPDDGRPVTLNDLVTCRYDEFFRDADWRAAIQIREPLEAWVEEHVAAVSSNVGE